METLKWNYANENSQENSKRWILGQRDMGSGVGGRDFEMRRGLRSNRDRLINRISFGNCLFTTVLQIVAAVLRFAKSPEGAEVEDGAFTQYPPPYFAPGINASSFSKLFKLFLTRFLR